MRRLLLITLAILLSAQTLATDLVETKALDNLISLKIPAEFEPISAEMMQLKYPRGTPPQVGYSNTNGTVSIVFGDRGPKALDLARLSDLAPVLTQTLNQTHPSIKWHQSHVKPINGHDWLILEFTSQAIDSPIRNLMAITSANGHLLMVSFNTTQELEKQWLTVGRQIIDSIKVNEP